MKRRFWVMMVAAAMLPGAMGGQTVAKAMAFDVVSIRENTSGGNPGKMGDYGPTADGYHLRNLPMGIVMLSAYAPSQGGAAFFNPQQIQNMPDWMMRDRYDIDARVGQGDLAAWQDPSKQTEMLHAMLGQMLEERLKLKVHREIKEVPVWELTVAKGGLKEGVKPSKVAPDVEKLKATNERVAALPGGSMVAPGSRPGEYVFYGATMASLGVMLQNLAGRPIQNHTGLEGRYDFTLQTEEREGMTREDLGPMLIDALGQLGLKLQAGKGEVETLVIDHVERPSEN